MPFSDVIDSQGRRQTRHSFVQHNIERPGTILVIGHHLHIAEQHQCLVQSLSCAGAIVDIAPHVHLPASFFLVVHGSREEIGATEFKRDSSTVWIRFNMFLAPDFLHILVHGRKPAMETA